MQKKVNSPITFGPKSQMEDIIARLNSLARNKRKYVFRGYNKQEEMIPGIIRDTDFRNKERKFLIDFEKYGSNYFHATTPIDFMSYAQHFGIPTRLLDFTYNPFIALSFSLYMKKGPSIKDKDDKEYYYIRYAVLEDNICLNSIVYSTSWEDVEKPIESMAEKAWGCITNVTEMYEKSGKVNSIYKYVNNIELEKDQQKYNDQSILFIDPNQANQRIIMQQGLFMFPYTLNEAEHQKIIKDKTNCIMIHKKHRERLLEYLDMLGYNTFRLMPDLNSICKEIKRRNKAR